MYRRTKAFWKKAKRMRHHIAMVGVLAVMAVLPLNCRHLGGPREDRIPVVSDPTGALARPVRVLLAGDVSSAQVGIAGPFEVRPAGTGRAVRRGASLPDGLVAAAPGGFQVGGLRLEGTALDLVPAVDGTAQVNGQRYRGAIRLVQRSAGTFHVVNVVPLESYLMGVINGEMPANYPAEALKAQAVAARTYALFQMFRVSPSSPYDVRNNEFSQVYLGLGGETASSRNPVASTAGVILLYEGRLFCTYYSSTCGGHTQDSRFTFDDPPIPPLGGVACPYCGGSKYARWEETIPLSEITASVDAALLGRGRSVGEVTSLQVLERAESGHVARLRVVGQRGAVDLRGVEFRHALGTRRLRSTNFQMQSSGAGIRFVGRGFGHGVGMCQVGAKGAAEAGLDFLAILQYYYPQASAVRVSAKG